MPDHNASYWWQLRSLFGRRREQGAERRYVRSDDSTCDSSALSSDQPLATESGGAKPVQIQSRQDFDRRLREIATQRNTAADLMAGKIHIVNLASIRERMQDGWAKHADRVHSIVKNELDRRLTSHDLYTKLNDDSYVIVFGDCSEMEGRIKVALLCEQIMAKLFGDSEAKDTEFLGVESVISTVSGEAATEALSSSESLLSMLNKTSSEASSRTRTYRATVEGSALTPQEIASLLGDVELHLSYLESLPKRDAGPKTRVDGVRRLVRLLEELEDRFASQDALWAQQPARKGRRENLNWEEFHAPALLAIQQLKARAERQVSFVYSQSPATEKENASDELDLRVEFRYLPLWQAVNAKIGVYRCQPMLELGGDYEPQAGAGGPEAEIHMLAIIDRITLRRARADLKATIDEGQRSVVIVPLHLCSLRQKNSQMKITELCSNIPDNVRRFLIWEIQGAGPDDWKSDLPKAVEFLKPFGRAIFVQIADPARTDLAQALPRIHETGALSVGMDLGGLALAETSNLALLEKLAKEAKARDLSCYVDGIDSLSRATWAISAGYQHISGAVVGEPLLRPQGLIDKPIASLYDHLAYH